MPEKKPSGLEQVKAKLRATGYHPIAEWVDNGYKRTFVLYANSGQTFLLQTWSDDDEPQWELWSATTKENSLQAVLDAIV